MTRKPQNLSHSIRDRLLQLARQQNEEFQNYLMRFALERWMYRLSQSKHQDRFILKGAMLFALWSDDPHRPTQDLDLLGVGGSSVRELEEVFRQICVVDVAEDGLEFLPESVQGGAIREDNIYDGVRVKLRANLGNAVIPLQIDIGFGDAITPEPEWIEYPASLDLPAPRLRAYRRETVIAEKFNAMVELGLRNTRCKDFYDLWVLSRTYDFDGPELQQALRDTFARRRTPLPQEDPLAFTPAFSESPLKQTQWRAFVRRGKLKAGEISLPEIILSLREFLLPPVAALRANLPFTQQWKAGGPWSN